MAQNQKLKIVTKDFGIVPERLSQASPSRKACAECGLHESCDEAFLTPYVPESWTGQFAFIIEVSKKGEENVGRGVFLSDQERAILRECMSSAGIAAVDVALVPVLRCRPSLTGSKKPKMHWLRACRPFLIRAIKELNPYHVLAFGDTCVKAVMNTGAVGPITMSRGRALPMQLDDTTPLLRTSATVKLSSLLTDPHAKNRLKEDLRRILLTPTEYPVEKLPKLTKFVGFDTEYTPTEVLTVGVASEDAAIAFPASKSAECVPVLKDAILVGHQITVDIESLMKLGHRGLTKAIELWLQGKKQRDTVLEARLADENRGKNGYKLESLTTSFYNIKDWKGPTEALGPDPTKWPVNLRTERCKLDAWATLLVHKACADSIRGPNQLSHAIAMSLRRMYWAGVYIDGTTFKRMSRIVSKERAEALASVEMYAKKFKIEDFSATRDECLREYVYGEKGAGLSVETYTKGGLPTVSVKALKEYKDVKSIAALLTFSKYDKLHSTYCESLSNKFVPVKDGIWMPVQINPLAAKTGRRSSNAPNFQNWPVPVRRIIVSRFKGGVIADNDYSKLEPIIGGWVAGEPKLTEYFVKYPNGYIKIGEDFFKKSVDKTSDQYRAVKALILAIIYHKKQWSLAEDLWVNHNVKLDSNYERHTEKAGDILDDFLDRLFPKIKEYHQRQIQAVKKYGYVDNALGQRRRLPLPDEPPRSERFAYKLWCRFRAHVENQAINYPIQSLASYVTGCGLIDLESALLSHHGYSFYEYHMALMEKKWPRMPLLCIEVHDDIVQDIPHGQEKKTKEITHDIMTKPPSLVAALPELFDSNVKLSVDTNIGPTWGLKS